VNNARRVGTGDADPLLNGTVAELPSDSTPAIATQVIAGNARRATLLARAIIADRELRAARTLAETFITNGKAGSSADTAVGDVAIILSFALQYGADAEAIRRAVSRNSEGEPSGVMGAVLDRLAEDGAS
jgi:hypothetical protein